VKLIRMGLCLSRETHGAPVVDPNKVSVVVAHKKLAGEP